MFTEMKNDFERFNGTVRNKVNEIKYSSEYLDLKDNLSSAGKKAKHIVENDLSSAAKNFGALCKKMVRNEKFQRLIIK